ncbi:MAG: M20/M25/M40 family metallo-hydrolase [Clostridia bacterium]|nr:M20/M25/M40 family metallo-hydrolase [Clostridia bacterium]
MNIFLPVLYITLGLIGLLLLIMVIRTICNKPKIKIGETPILREDLDKEKIAKHISEAVQIPTISMVEEYKDNTQAFLNYHKWLEKTYPLLHKYAEKTLIADYSLIYHLKGKNAELKPACFLAHQDVVPATDEGWEEGCFSGKITDDDYIYGRGSQDMKGHMIALLEALEHLLAKNQEFERDIYLCFGHDEEPGTSFDGAPNIVKHLLENGVEMEFVIDEGGTMLDGSLLGVPATVALIGACEKGNCDIEISVHKAGGHASNPKRPTAVGLLTEAVSKIEKNPMPTRWTPMAKETFKTLAPYCKPLFKFIFTNRDIMSPALKKLFTVAAPMTNALVRTTFAPTMLWGATARNVIPYDAKANINTRILTGETIDDVVAYLKKLLGKKIDVNVIACTNPTPEADINHQAYKEIVQSINECFENVVVAPYPFIAATDARFYYPLTNNVFRFGPFINSIEDQNRIHGLNERISKNDMEKATQFFIRCLLNTCAKN